MTTPLDIQRIATDLSAPFPADAVSWRIGTTTADKKRGLALAYIDARDVMDRLDLVMGCENWSDAYSVVPPRVLCSLALRFPETNEWISKQDAAGDPDFESEKGAFSDAFKRAAVKWGIGRYLYRVEAPWVAVEQHGSSVRIAASEYARLRALLTPQKPGTLEANLASGIKDAGIQMSADGLGVGPAAISVQALKMADQFKTCATLLDLQNAWAASQVIVRSLHIADRRYLDAIKDELKAKLQ